MNSELARKRPATVFRTAPLHQELIVSGRNRAEVERQLITLARAGQIEKDYQELPSVDGLYRAKIKRVPDPEPRVGRPWLIPALFGTVIVLLLVIFAKPLTTMLTSLVHLLIVGGIVLALGGVVIGALMGGRSVEVIQKVRIRG